MSSEDQLSLFDASIVNQATAQVSSQPELIPTTAKIPIPPGTYSTMV